MDELKKGDLLILIKDGSTWEFDSYGESFTERRGIPGLDWSGSQPIDQASIFVRPLETNSATEERMPEEFKRE